MDTDRSEVALRVCECETPLDGAIQHKWTCKRCGTVWEVVNFDDQGNPEWEDLDDQS